MKCERNNACLFLSSSCFFARIWGYKGTLCRSLGEELVGDTSFTSFGLCRWCRYGLVWWETSAYVILSQCWFASLAMNVLTRMSSTSAKLALTQKMQIARKRTINHHWRKTQDKRQNAHAGYHELRKRETKRRSNKRAEPPQKWETLTSTMVALHQATTCSCPSWPFRYVQ